MHSKVTETRFCFCKLIFASTLKTLRALRIFRALRPLRVIKRDPGLRLVVNSLFLAAAPIGTVTLVTRKY